MDNQTTNQETTNETPASREPAESVNQTPVTTPEMPAPEPELLPQSETAVPSNEYQQVLNEYSNNSEKPPALNLSRSSDEQQLQDLGISPPPKAGGGFVKGLFTFALILFILVFAGLAFVYFKSKNDSSMIDDLSSTIDDLTPTISSGTCFLNDKTYQIGESFAATDGCNTCSCQSQDIITCTEKACATPTVATKSATITPTTAITPTP